MKIQPVQIIGTQRSGSNLLRLLLNQFPGVTAPHPPHILQRFVPLLANYEDPDYQGNFYKLIDDVATLVELNPVPWHISFDREEIMRRCETKSLYEIFRRIYERKAEQEKAGIWVCKSMTNVNYLNELERFDPKPKYIHLIRDGRDVSCSFQNAIVGDKHIYNLAKYWKKEQDACLNIVDRVDGDRIIRIRYENLISRPEEEMNKVAAFLGVSFTKEIFDFYKSSESIETARAGKMWQNLTKPILENNFNKYKNQLSREDILLFENIAGDTLKELGYVLDFPYDREKLKFSGEQILRFNRENIRMKKEVINHADKEDINRRSAQKKFLERLSAERIKVKQLQYVENNVYEKRAII